MKRKSDSYHLDNRAQSKKPYTLLRNSYREDGKVKKEPVFEADGVGKDRKYTFDSVMEILKCIRKETVVFCGIESSVITALTEEHKQIFHLFNISM